MKQKIIIIVESAFLLLAIISLIGLYQDNKSKEVEIQENKETIETLNANLDVQNNANDTENVSDKIDYINNAFSLYLNYETDTYVSRFEEMKNYFSPSVLEKLTGASGTEKPQMAIESSISNYATYINPLENNSFVFVTDINYQVEDNEPTTFYNVYLVNLAEENGETLIDNVDVFSGAPTNK